MEVPGAEARRVADNVWEITIPRSEAVLKATGRGPALEDWDGAVFFVEGQETEPALGSGEGRDALRVTALVLDA